MSEIKTIDTTKYVKEGKVQIDGMLWSVVLPGAGKELEMSKAQRRIKLLDKKISNDDYTETDLDQYDKLEDYVYGFFKSIFKDSTKDNSEVEKWLDETPMAIIIKSFEDIKEQSQEVI